MSVPVPNSPVSGAAMDLRLPRRRGKRIAISAALLLAAGAAAWALRAWIPRGLQVAASELRIASVERGIYRDDVVVRANAEPLNSVMLDSVESGRVEAVYADDGALVRQGQLLFRISNPQRHLELLAREAEHAQQISNLSNLRVAQEASRSEHQRRMDDLDFALQQARKQQARDARLAARGYISEAAMEESDDRLHQQEHALAQERQADDTEAAVRHDALSQLDEAIKGLRAGLQLVGSTVDALAVRAPVAGRLTDFHLQVGASIATGTHVGRIDDPRRFKLSAQVDEFYLNRVAPGRSGTVHQDERSYAVRIAKVYPQITEGRFAIELAFSDAQPPVISPGQSFDAQLTLGEPAPALLLPNGAFINDSGGAWVYALTPDGAGALRREVRLGRRNNGQVEVLAGLAAGDKVVVSSYAAFGKSPRLQISQ